MELLSYGGVKCRGYGGPGIGDALGVSGAIVPEEVTDEAQGCGAGAPSQLKNEGNEVGGGIPLALPILRSQGRVPGFLRGRCEVVGRGNNG